MAFNFVRNFLSREFPELVSQWDSQQSNFDACLRQAQQRPKKPRSAYILFCVQNRPHISGKPTEVTKELAQRWRTLAAEEKQIFEAMAARERTEQPAPPSKTVSNKKDVVSKKPAGFAQFLATEASAPISEAMMIQLADRWKQMSIEERQKWE